MGSIKKIVDRNGNVIYPETSEAAVLTEDGKSLDEKFQTKTDDALATTNKTIVEAINELNTNKANKADIPTKTSDLTNDNNYTTEDELNTKVDKVTGKGLSTEDYTTAEKNKLANLSTVATSGNYNDLTNKPTIPSTTDVNNAIKYKGVISTDVNTCVETGFYKVQQGTANLPIDEYSFLLVYNEAGENTLIQVWYSVTSDKQRIRRRANNTWGEWYVVYTENEPPTTPTSTSQLTYDVTMLGAKGDNTDETETIQAIIDDAPENCTVLFPPNRTFKFATINITKSICINATGATLTQSTSQNVFINISSNNVKVYGGNYVAQGTNGITVNGKNNSVSSIKVDGGEHGILIQGNNCIIEDCISENATYAGFKINFGSGDKRDCVTIRNCKAVNFAYKGIVYNGVIGSRKIIIENFEGTTNTTITASDNILIDAGDGTESSYFIDEVIIDNARLYGGESNSMKIYHANNLTLRNIYARNEHSKYSSSSGLRIYAKNSYLENIDIDNRIIANENIKINGLYFSSNATPYSIIELGGGGTRADFNNINLNIEKVSSYAIRVSRNEGVQHKITLDNYNAPTGIKIFGIFKYPPNAAGFIEVYDKKLLTGYNVAGTSQNENEIIRSPRTFVASSLPTRGTYNKGDIIYNSSLVAGGNLGWVCISPGTFGGTAPIFKTFGTIEN